MEKSGPLFKAKCGIILAADVPSLEDLRKLAELSLVTPEVVGVKVGFTLALRFGLPAIVKFVNDINMLPVIYDHQKAATDIPAMGKPFAETCRDAGVKGVIFFPHAGPKTLEAFVSAGFDCGLETFLGLSMTHPQYHLGDGGFIVNDAPDKICKIGIDLGVRSFVLPGNKPDLIKKFAQGPLISIQPTTIIMPGIGSQGGSISTATEATKGHHPFFIIGSAIYRAPDPEASLLQFVSEMRECN